jgi:hypothetical protein
MQAQQAGGHADGIQWCLGRNFRHINH